VPASAPAKVKVAVGLGDQQASMFANPFYQALGLKKTRYFIPWDGIDRAYDRARADEFVANANSLGVKVLMHISTNDLRPKIGKLPTVARYKSKVKRLVKRYRARGVKDWGVWNEANHNTQETYKNPKRAAQFYKAFRKVPCKGCTIVALDVLDQAGVQSYIKRWFKAAGKTAGAKAKVFGIHNYSEVNRLLNHGSTKYPGTKRIITAVRKKNKKARFWYTETGGIVQLASFTCDPVSRPVTTLTHMFKLAKRFDKYIERLYAYNWTGDDCMHRFDAGLAYANGQPRPGYYTFKSRLPGFTR
jgi:hypothetical protein